MARYCRVLRMVVNAIVGLSLLFGSLPVPLAAARTMGQPQGSQGNLPDVQERIAPSPVSRRFAESIPPAFYPADFLPSAAPTPREMAKEAATVHDAHKAQAATFTPRALPLSFTSDRSILSPMAPSGSAGTPSDGQGVAADGLQPAGINPSVPSNEERKAAPALLPFSNWSWVTVGTNKGVFYTDNIDDAAPRWSSMNQGFSSDSDRNVVNLAQSGSTLWALTATGAWKNAAPFGGGSWTLSLDADTVNDVSTTSGYYYNGNLVTSTIGSISWIDIDISVASSGLIMVAFTGTRNGKIGAWTIRSTDGGDTWQNIT